ncbi:2014_t:CDS:2 [Paraglomus brasilianum]|uniref:Peroxisomal membrane protein PEX14 n=1 Tax=Paraglomus brasilianum TaxID=144538 RepID=A0A9N8WKG2_9GLOM|nr:2014_t:CDS:2 [Paraglomus brasilianum]
MSTSRANLIQSAVNFLRDPTVQNAPLQKRVSFLESKGLTSEEIEDALKQAKGGATASQTEGSQAAAVTAAAPPGQQVVHAVPPPVPRMDWRDYFIAAVIIGGVGWAVIAKYVAPLLGTPTATELERDKRALTSQFDSATETLDTVKSDTQVARKHVEEQSAVIKQSLENLDVLLKAVRDNDEKREVAIKSLKEEIDAIKDLLPKLLEKSKESQAQQMNDLQQELKSLKSLLLNRGSVVGQPPSSAATGTPNITALPQKGGNVSIPSWQMTENNGISGSSNSTEQEDETNNVAAGTNGTFPDNTSE